VSKLLLALACAFALAPFSAAQRLPEIATPQSYQLTLTPNFESEDFAGEETIELNVLKPTSNIVLNSAEIKFAAVSVSSSGQTQSASISLNEPKEQASFTFEKPLSAGPATLHIRYTGILNDHLRGFYLSKANNRKYAITQLENTDARRMYPSFDEPAYKATFSITAIVDKPDTALSNGKLLSDTPGPGENQHTLKFATTPKMSSYLVALAVGDWECLEGSADGIPIRICGVPGKKQYSAFALQAAEFAMKYYNHYFGIKYPYGKLDILGVADFSAGAMENTGLIIARDILFVDPKGSTYGLRKIVAQHLVSHEMAHQWFGDLVTMQWWDDIWLNEGFATWMAFKPTAAFKPEWNLQNDAVNSSTTAMGTDSLSSTRAIEAHAETPEEISELFDGIAYNKAGAVLQMVEGYVGEETFRKGVNSYVSKHAYANATSEDFWNEIARVSGKPVDRIMSGFVKQPGVPLVNVKTACLAGKTSVTLTQQRYFRDRAALEKGSKEKWAIPVCLKAGKAEKCVLLDSKEQHVEFYGCNTGVYANAGAHGYFRSGYDAENLRLLSSSIEKELSAGERYLLLVDALSEMRVNRLGIDDFLSLIQNMKDDPSTAVTRLFRDQLEYIGDYLLNDADRSLYQAWVRTTFAPAAEKIGWTPVPGDSDETRARRANLLYLVGLVGHDPKATQFSRALVDQALKGESVDRTLLAAALPVAVREGDAALFEVMANYMSHATTPEDVTMFGSSFSLFSDPALLTKTLNYAISPEMRSQDAPDSIAAVFYNPAGRQLAWDFIREHWSEVEAKLSHYSVAQMVGVGDAFCDPAKRAEFLQFFAEHKVPASERTLQLTRERIDGCIDLRAQQESRLQAWLQQQPR
jgi:aminopeptidase N